MLAPDSPIQNGVYQLSPFAAPDEDLYLQVRKKENRLYSDAEVAALPEPFLYNLHRQEWALRARSMRRLLAYLKGQDAAQGLLEIGCGNGWLSARIAQQTGWPVWGLDVNAMELEQAARVFSEPNLKFGFGDVFAPIFPSQSFSMVLICSSIQYFPDLPKLIKRAQELLVPTGEIHIMDSPLYQDKEIEAAQGRSKEYYVQLGMPQMAAHYFHHRKADLQGFSYRYMYRPGSWRRLFSRGPDVPFPWIKIVAG